MTMIRPEFSRPVCVSRIGSGGIEHAIEANAAECRALASRLRIHAIASFTCSFRLSPPLRGQIAVEADLRAEVTQTCVVSLELFEATVAERFALRFVPRGAEEDDLDPESLDELPYDGDSIDLGEAATEQLALALDPYPRMPGIVLPPEAGEPFRENAADTGPRTTLPEQPNPFAALARLRGPAGTEDA